METPRPTKLPWLIELVSDEAKIKTQIYLTPKPSPGHELLDNVRCYDRAPQVLKSHPEGAEGPHQQDQGYQGANAKSCI